MYFPLKTGYCRRWVNQSTSSTINCSHAAPAGDLSDLYVLFCELLQQLETLCAFSNTFLLLLEYFLKWYQRTVRRQGTDVHNCAISYGEFVRPSINMHVLSDLTIERSILSPIFVQVATCSTAAEISKKSA